MKKILFSMSTYSMFNSKITKHILFIILKTEKKFVLHFTELYDK